MRKTKVALIGTNGLPARYGGFETLAEYLVKYLNAEYDFTIYCSKTVKQNRLKTYNNSKLVYLPLKANGWQSMLYDGLSILHAYCFSETLLIFGFSGVIAFPFRVLTKTKIIFNIGGIEWKKVRGNKSMAGIEVLLKKWFEKLCVRFSDIIIADNQVLFDYLNNTYHKKIVLAEYGGDHAVYKPKTDVLCTKYPFLALDYDLSVSRAQEDMNIHLLIEAYKSIPQRNLVIVSNWNISVYGMNLYRANKNVYPNIFLIEAVYDLDVLNAIRGNCKLYIHSHSLCGTAPSLVEAMSLHLPVICFDVDTNHATTEERSYYFRDVSSLQKILQALDRETIGKLADSMYEIAKRRYRWNRITGIYRECIS
jgi:glycosyltransferase involved in cell wall biosynthesis